MFLKKDRSTGRGNFYPRIHGRGQDVFTQIRHTARFLRNTAW